MYIYTYMYYVGRPKWNQKESESHQGLCVFGPSLTEGCLCWVPVSLGGCVLGPSITGGVCVGSQAHRGVSVLGPSLNGGVCVGSQSHRGVCVGTQ